MAKPSGEPVSVIVLIYRRERIASGTWSSNLTARGVCTDLYKFADTCRNPPIGRVTRSHVLKFIGRGDVAPATKSKRWQSLKSFTRWCRERGYMDHDPMEGIPRPRVPRRLPRGLPPDDSRRIYDAVPDARGRVMVSLMLQEGLRRAEVARLEVADVDFSARSVFVRGKGGHERLLPLSPETEDAIVAYLGEFPATSGPLIRSFHNDRLGITPDRVGFLVGQWMREAGVKRAPWDGRSGHALRHSMATDMLKRGAHVRDVQRALGHTSLMTTERYLPAVVDDLRLAMGGRTYRADT